MRFTKDELLKIAQGMEEMGFDEFEPPVAALGGHGTYRASVNPEGTSLTVEVSMLRGEGMCMVYLKNKDGTIMWCGELRRPVYGREDIESVAAKAYKAFTSIEEEINSQP